MAEIVEPVGSRGKAEWALIVLGLCLLFFSMPHGLESDGAARFQALNQWVTGGGTPDIPYSMIGPLFSAPFWLLGKLYKSPEWWCARYNFFLFAFGLILLYRIARKHLEPAVLRKFFLILITASMFPNHLRYFMGEVFTAVAAGLGMAALVQQPCFWGWCCLALAVANTPASLAGMGLVSLKRALDSRRWRYALALAAAALLILGEAWIRRGHPLSTGYENDAGNKTLMPYSGQPEFSYPFYFGLLSIFFSFGKGLLFFAPGLLLPVRPYLPSSSSWARETYQLWLLFLVGLILVYAKWWSWYGGWFWGPRFFLFASIPASFAIALRLAAPDASLLARSATLLALLLSIWVGVSGAVFDQGGLDLCTGNYAIINQVTREFTSGSYFALEFLAWYVPEFSVLWRPFVATRNLSAPEILLLVYGLIIFLWLGMPLMISLARDFRAKFQKPWNSEAASSPWRF